MTFVGSCSAARAKAARVGLLLMAFVFIACAPGCKDKDKATSPAPEDEPTADAAHVPRRPVTFRDASAPAAVAIQDPCEPGLLRCAGACIDPATSNQHCGACGNSCFSGYACRQRRCEFICQAGTMRCGSSCLNVSSDARNCGGCGTSCFPDQVCSDGLCGCAKDKTACAGVCIQPQLGSCGPCGKDCPEDVPCDDAAAHAADWPTHAADMSRTGYNQGEHGTPPLSDGWAVSVMADPLYPALVSGARVFVSGQTKYGGNGGLFALDLNTGATLWKYDLAGAYAAGQATLVNCRVYVQSNASSTNTSRVWAVRADTSEVVWSRTVPWQPNLSWSPTATAEGVYLGASTGGLSGFARKGGAELFRSTEPAQSSGPWVAAVHGPDLFTFVTGALRRHDAKSGKVLDTISVKWSSSFTTTPTSFPVFSPEGVVYLVAPPTLYAFEAISKRLVWSYGANVSGMPVLAEGRVITFDSQLLTSFDAKTGAMQWRNLDVEGLVQTPVAAAGYAYAASKTTTYAFDLRDGSVAWSAQVSGLLSIGGGRLFVASDDGILHSYVLAQPAPAMSAADAGVH